MERWSTGQDKYSTEIVLQGYNSSLTMRSRNSGNNSNLVSENKSSLPNDNLNQDKSILMMKFPFNLNGKNKPKKINHLNLYSFKTK